MPQNSVVDITQTADGYLWLTTNDGLVRFDGVRFTVFNKGNSPNLPNNRLGKMLADGNDLWIGVEGGVVRFRDGKFRQFTKADGFLSDNALSINKRIDGKILVYTHEGIFRFENDAFTQVEKLKGEEVFETRYYFAPSGTLWKFTKEKLTKSKDGQTTEYAMKPAYIEPESRKFSSWDVTPLETIKGEFWFVLGDNIYKLQNGEIFKILLNIKFNARIAADNDGNVWFGLSTKGVCHFVQNQLQCFDADKALAGFDDINQIFFDREGTLWIATNANGLFRMTEQLITPLYTDDKLVGKNVYPILEDSQGAIWIGTSDGLSVLRGGKFTDYRNEKEVYIQSLFEDRDERLWIGNHNPGLYFFQNGKYYDTQETLGFEVEPYPVNDIHQDKNGVLWFASSRGLYNFDGTNLKHLTTADGLPGDDVKVIVESRDNKTLWIGTYAGLAAIKDGKISFWTEVDGLTGNHIRSLFEDESGTLWIGTYDTGLSQFRDGKFTNYKKANGLFSDGVFQILPDETGNFWMSSNQGIYRVSRSNLEDYAAGKIKRIISTGYGKFDGMLSSEANGGGQPAGIKTSDGRLMFPTQNGVAVINPEAVKINPLPPPVVIETIRIDNVEQSKIQNPKSKIEMLPGQENLEIDYTGLSFIKPEQIRFRYRLEGLDESWTEAGNRRTAFFPHLAQGKYTFHVIAANSDNVWNEEGVKLKVVVKPPFYQTWIFLLACIAFAGLIIYALYRRRISNLERSRRMQEEFSRRLINAHESERRRIAAELHDSVGQSLAMIKNRVVQSSESIADKKTKQQLDLITEQTTQTIGEVREISYNLRPYLLENLGLTRAVKSLLNKVAETGQIKIQTELDDVDDLFDAEAEMSIYRIIQENLTNILKHAEANEVQVLLKKSERNLTILISDDGKGFDINAVNNKDFEKGGFGLLGISERVKMLGGTQEIESDIGEGTNVLIKIPLPKKADK
ncbi:MAG: two-component regulator propeller domain-containing protein [Pyrinomonadaceae bacterium]